MTNDEQQIRQVVADWMAATKAGDSARVLSLMTDDVVFLVPGAPPFGKQAFAAASGQQAAARMLIDGQSEIEEVQVLGDWAFLRNKLTVRVTQPNGATVTRAGYTLSIFRKQDGQWRLARDANLLTVVP